MRRSVTMGLVGLGVTAWLGWGPRVVPEAAQGIPRLVVTPQVIDVGTIRKSGGKVEAKFTLRNEGQAPLRIQRIVPT
ncbi:MAG: DUF1573 domain-containing protein [candidate division NC10 bacterium]|nr:DUF1573 domain-containing protein [candidate division NC10 bacterium]